MAQTSQSAADATNKKTLSFTHNLTTEVDPRISLARTAARAAAQHERKLIGYTRNGSIRCGEEGGRKKGPRKSVISSRPCRGGCLGRREIAPRHRETRVRATKTTTRNKNDLGSRRVGRPLRKRDDRIVRLLVVVG